MSGKIVGWVVGILALTAGIVCWCALPLIWDGAFQLSVTLLRQHPFVYLTRFHTLILWQPTVWASHFTDNPWILQAIYGFPFIIAPAVSIAVSWWIVRKQAPGLIIWAIFGVAAGTLPGQVFIINDSIWQQTLFWPIFLAVFVDINAKQFFVLCLLGMFQFVHQIGLPLFVGASAAALILAQFDYENRPRYLRTAIFIGILALAALLKIIITNHIKQFEDTYAEQEFSWWKVREKWQMAVLGYPLAGLICAWIAAICLFVWSTARKELNRRALGTFAIVLILAMGGIWIVWAADGHRWYKALDYRRWILPLTLPFFTLAFLEACAAARRRAEGGTGFDVVQLGQTRAAIPLGSALAEAGPRAENNTSAKADPTGIVQKRRRLEPRAVCAILLALIFGSVLSIQGLVWSRMLKQFVRQIDASPRLVTRLDSIEWIRESPLDHWGSCDAITLLQGKVPRSIVVTDEQFRGLLKVPALVPNQGWFPQKRRKPPPPGPRGWYDFRPFMKKLAASGMADLQTQPSAKE
ncbi:MAG TPA: hypothetical protein VH370_23340 [Humisphaera sp.]|nr:hypothetical protein [Humisphaera sp.]